MTQKNGYKIAWLLGVPGVASVAVAIFADALGLGKSPGFFGRYQFWLVSVGMVLIVLAVLFALLSVTPRDDH